MNQFVTLIMLGKPMRVAVYYRVSTDKQSIRHQELAIDEWIAAQGYKPTSIIRFSDEGVSGAVGQLKRVGYRKLLNEVQSGRLDRVILFETSRASRDFLDYLKFLDLCHRSKCEVEVIGKGVQHFSTSQDMLMASIHAFLGQAERERVSERVRSGIRAAKARGVKFGARKGEARKQGFKKTYDASLVSEIEKLARKGLSNRAIAEVLGDKHSPGKPISYSTVRLIRLRQSQS